MDVEGPAVVLHLGAVDRAGAAQIQGRAAADGRHAVIGVGARQGLGPGREGQAARPTDGAGEGPHRVGQGQGVGSQRHRARAVEADDRGAAGVAGDVEGPAIGLHLGAGDRARPQQLQRAADRRLAGVGVGPGQGDNAAGHGQGAGDAADRPAQLQRARRGLAGRQRLAAGDGDVGVGLGGVAAGGEAGDLGVARHRDRVCAAQVEGDVVADAEITARQGQIA